MNQDSKDFGSSGDPVVKKQEYDELNALSELQNLLSSINVNGDNCKTASLNNVKPASTIEGSETSHRLSYSDEPMNQKDSKISASTSLSSSDSNEYLNFGAKEDGTFGLKSFLLQLLENLRDSSEESQMKSNCLLNYLCFLVSGLPETEDLNCNTELKEIVNCYLKKCCQETNIGVLCLLRMFCSKSTAAKNLLVQSDLPIVLMTDICYDRTDRDQLPACLQMLIALLPSSPSANLPPHMKILIENSFLVCLTNLLKQQSQNKKLQRITAKLLLCIYQVEALANKVVARILASDSNEISVCLIEMAKKKGTSSLFWNLLADLLFCEGSEVTFSKSCMGKLVELVKSTLQSLKYLTKDDKSCLVLLEALCGVQNIAKEHIQELQECLWCAYHIRCVPKQDKKRLWTLWKDLQNKVANGRHAKEADVVKCAVTSREESHIKEVFLSDKLFKEATKLNQYLRSIASFREHMVNFFVAPSRKDEIISLLLKCRDVMAHMHFYPIREEKSIATPIPYNLQHIRYSMDSLNCIFQGICCVEAHKLILQIMIEICDLFPQVVGHMVQLELVPCFTQEMKHYLDQDEEMFEFCALLLRRLLIIKTDLPTVVLNCFTEGFIRNLIDAIEKNISERFAENIAALILALDAHTKSRVIAAFSHHRCDKTVQTILNFLQQGQSPIIDTPCDVGWSSVCSPMKIYSDLIESASTADLLRNDCLQSVLMFGISHLTIKTPSSTVPEAMAYHFRNIFLSSFRISELHTSRWSGLLEEAVATFEKKKVLVKDALDLLHRFQQELKKVGKSLTHAYKSKSHCHFPVHYCNSSCTRRCMSFADFRGLYIETPNKETNYVKNREDISLESQINQELNDDKIALSADVKNEFSDLPFGQIEQTCGSNICCEAGSRKISKSSETVLRQIQS